MRKLIAFDDDTLDKLTQLARDRMGTFQELADEAFADLLKKHGIPVDLKDALRKSAGLSKATTPKKNRELERLHHESPTPTLSSKASAPRAKIFRRKPILIRMAASEHALWAAGHEKIAGAREANESEGT